MGSKIFIDYFPSLAEPNPFFFKSKEDYENAYEALNKLWYAQDEWEDILSSKKEITNSDIKRWQQLLDNYEKTLNEGLQDRFKQGDA